MRYAEFSWVKATSRVRGQASKAGSLTGLAFVLLVTGGPVAERADAAEGESASWSATHMASQHRKAEPLKAPKIIIGDASTTLTEPPATIPTYTQRTWESGTYSGPGKRSKLGHGPNDSGRRSAQTAGNVGSNARRRISR